MIKSMSLDFWNNLRLFQNNKPLIMFLNHFSNSSFFLGLYQVLLRSSLFKISLVGDVYLKRLKWCVVICPKSQVNCQWILNYFVRMSLSPSDSSLVMTCQWTLTEFPSGLLSSTDLLDWCRGPCGCPSQEAFLNPISKERRFYCYFLRRWSFVLSFCKRSS